MANKSVPKILYAFRVDSLVLDEMEKYSKEINQSCSSLIRSALFSFLRQKKLKNMESI